MIGNRIKELRLESKLTQKDLADKLNLTPKMVSFYELGERFPPHDILAKLADIFDVSSDYILGRKEVSVSKTPTETAIDFFVAENGREPTNEELKSFLAVAKGLFSTLPDKGD